jgi:hypothetical protein
VLEINKHRSGSDAVKKMAYLGVMLSVDVGTRCYSFDGSRFVCVLLAWEYIPKCENFSRWHGMSKLNR